MARFRPLLVRVSFSWVCRGLVRLVLGPVSDAALVWMTAGRKTALSVERAALGSKSPLGRQHGDWRAVVSWVLLAYPFHWTYLGVARLDTALFFSPLTIKPIGECVVCNLPCHQPFHTTRLFHLMVPALYHIAVSKGRLFGRTLSNGLKDSAGMMSGGA